MTDFAGPVQPGYSENIFRNFGQQVPNSQARMSFALPRTGPAPVQSHSPGQVLGAQTSSPQPQFQQPSNPSPNISSMEDQMRQGISSGWDSYLNGLNDIGNTWLPQQQTAQQGIADTQLSAGQNAINSQKSKSLKDIASNTRNAFQAGNIYLGTRGAGDSSAANQYSFATQQEAAKQGSNLNEYVNTQLNTLQAAHDTQVQQIASWFAQAQQQLKQQIAQGGLGKQQDLNALSQNILNQAIQASNQVKSDTSARYNALLSWAANNSQNVSQLQSNIAGIPQAVGAPVDSTGNAPLVPYGQAGQDPNKRNSLFG